MAKAPKKKVSKKAAAAAEKRAQAQKEKAENSKPDPVNLGRALLVFRPELADENDPLAGIGVLGIYKAGMGSLDGVIETHQKIEPDASFRVVTI